MRETFGPFLASLGQVKRRSILFLFAAALVVWGLITWSSYTNYRSQRSAIQAVERGDFSPDRFYRLIGGFSCEQSESECRLNDRTGRPFGPPFALDAGKGPVAKDPVIDIVRQNLAEILPVFKADLAREGARLAPRTLLRDRAEALGTFFGILFAVLIASTLFGAEWRWGVWRSLLTHEPRRGRVLAAKLGALWVAVAAGLLVVLAMTVGLDVFLRQISDISASGGPRSVMLARVIGRSLLSLELYASLAAALAIAIRTSFAGMGALLFLLADGLATTKFRWLRHLLPTQQIATLIPGNVFSNRPGYVWWPLITGGSARCTVEGGGVVNCTAIPLKPIPHWRASVVLITWIVAFSLAAWALLRARDVPQ